MADINQIITLGIGTPGAIPEFLTFGLQIGEVSEGIILSADVPIRITAAGDTAIRTTAAGDSAIRITATGDVEL